jgi:translation initiation factor IF-1
MSTHQKKHIKHTGRNTRNNELHLADPKVGTAYGRVTAAKGSCRFEVVTISDNKTYNSGLRGKMQGKGGPSNRINVGDLVLLEHDACTTTKDNYYIVHKYSPADIRTLEKKGELTTVKAMSEEASTIVFEKDSYDTMTLVEKEIDITDI